MEYRKAKIEEIQNIYEIVQTTIRQIYPKYYLPEIVDAFYDFHSKENIMKDIEQGCLYVLLEAGKIVGTGTINENHITRVYVLPEFQGKGYGTYIMQQLEEEIGKRYNVVNIDASLPACRLYYKMGYRTIDHGEWKCTDNVIQIYEIMEKYLRNNNILEIKMKRNGE